MRCGAPPYAISDRLAIHEVNIQKEIKRHWREISSYVISVLRTTGISDVEAEELAILPGMEELSAMMYANQFRREQRYDTIVLDCAPTAESRRFVSMPTTLEWYMKHIFPFQRGLLKAVRPLANRVSPMELPPDSYFANIQGLFQRLDGIGDLLEDPRMTSVRLVTNPERMVLRVTQQAFVYFSLHGRRRAVRRDTPYSPFFDNFSISDRMSSACSSSLARISSIKRRLVGSLSPR